MDWTLLLLAMPAVFALGWFASRMDLRQLKKTPGPKPFFRGLNHLLNEEQDQAIDAFVEAVTNDPEATELHFALGNLFRKRGDYERAVRVHQHMLARADVSQADRLRAQQALAHDFWTAGLLDRAQSAYEELLNTPMALQARVGLLAVFERGRDWPAALQTAKALQAADAASVPNDKGNDTKTAPQAATQAVLMSLRDRMAHYLCEMAASAAATVPSATVVALLDEAQATSPKLPRPWVDTARWHTAQGNAQAALAAYRNLLAHAPSHIPLVAQEWLALAHAHGQKDLVQDLLQQHQAAQPSVDIMQTLTRAAPNPEAAREQIMLHLEKKPSLLAATQFLEMERLEHEQFHPQVQRALDAAVKPTQRYKCGACGFVSQTHFWQCPGCQSWDSIPAQRLEEL